MSWTFPALPFPSFLINNLFVSFLLFNTSLFPAWWTFSLQECNSGRNIELVTKKLGTQKLKGQVGGCNGCDLQSKDASIQVIKKGREEYKEARGRHVTLKCIYSPYKKKTAREIHCSVVRGSATKETHKLSPAFLWCQWFNSNCRSQFACKKLLGVPPVVHFQGPNSKVPISQMQNTQLLKIL